VCLIASNTIETVVADVIAAGGVIELGPVARIGARGPITSIYLRDPDGNLVDVAVYAGEAT
jgi:catechol 2,3-dioxygenase-like lactoylglutathione lyase family enzyme